MRRLKKLMLCSTLIGAAATFAMADAAAARFGAKGTYAPTGTVSYDKTTEASVESTALYLSPKLQYFFSRNIAIGGSLKYAKTTVVDTEASGYGVGANVGYNYAFNRRVSLFPQLELSYNKESPAVNAAKISRIRAEVEAPVLWRFGNFFLGVGPFYSTDLSANRDAVAAAPDDGKKKNEVENTDAATKADKVTRIGLRSVIGGWF